LVGPSTPAAAARAAPEVEDVQCVVGSRQKQRDEDRRGSQDEQAGDGGDGDRHEHRDHRRHERACHQHRADHEHERTDDHEVEAGVRVEGLTPGEREGGLADMTAEILMMGLAHDVCDRGAGADELERQPARDPWPAGRDRGQAVPRTGCRVLARRQADLVYALTHGVEA
jgi:hypothetical protein